MIHARLTAANVEIYVTRFSQDRISPTSRMNSIRRDLGTKGVIIDQLPSKEATHVASVAATTPYLPWQPQGTAPDRPSNAPNNRRRYSRLSRTPDSINEDLAANSAILLTALPMARTQNS